MSHPDRPEVVPIRTQRVPQTIETPVTFSAVPGAYVRFAYSRSSDSMAGQIEGQDYLCFRHNDQRLAFVVSDGVGSSFCGNLAARILGDNLLDWLWALDIGYLGGAAALDEAATSFLNRLQKQARHEVDEYELPDMGSPLIQQALEGQRAYGSEAIFAACRVDHPGPTMPDGLVSLFWMGDTRIHVLDDAGERIDLGGAWANANRWSTHRGVRGSLSAWMQPGPHITRIVSYTDGLSAHDAKVLAYPDVTLDREIRRGAQMPTSDDVAFIDVVLRTPEYDGYPDPELPDPNLERPRMEPIWNPTGAQTYEARWIWDGGGRPSFLLQEATSPALTDARTIEVSHGETSWRAPEEQEPGHYYYRVRAVRRFGGMTPWSDLRQTHVAYPPPPAPALQVGTTGSGPVLIWEGEGEALDYTLQQATTPDFAEPEIVFEGRSTSWTPPTAHPGTYYFRVRAVSDGGPGPWSEAQGVEVSVPAPPPPQLAPVNYGYTLGEYTLRWQPVARATYYELQETPRGRAADREPQVIRVEDTIYHVEDQDVGEYVYRLRACHEFGSSAWSAEQIAVISPRPPAEAPELTLDGPDEEGMVHLSWTEVPRALEYVVEASEDETFENARVYPAEGTTLELPRREPGLLTVRVAASNDGGEGPWSNVERCELDPPAPEWIEARAGEPGHAAVAWAAVGGRAQYRLEMRSGSDEGYEEIVTGRETQHEVPLPEDAQQARFRVRAEVRGVHSPWIESEPLRLEDAPPPPLIEPLEIDDRGLIHLRWTPVVGAESYRVEVAQDEAFEKVRSVDRTAPGIDFRPPARGRYWFRVRACRGKGDDAVCGAPSDAISTQVGSAGGPRLWPLDPLAAGEPFTVTWAGLPSCAYYELQESTDAAFATDSQTTRVLHPGQKLAIDGRPAGRYYFRVKAVSDEQDSSQWSNTIAVDVTKR